MSLSESQHLLSEARSAPNWPEVWDDFKVTMAAWSYGLFLFVVVMGSLALLVGFATSVLGSTTVIILMAVLWIAYFLS